MTADFLNITIEAKRQWENVCQKYLTENNCQTKSVYSMQPPFKHYVEIKVFNLIRVYF